MQVNSGCVSKLNNFVCFRFHAMLCYVILVHAFFVVGSVASKNRRVCKTFQKGLASGKGFYQPVQENYNRKCPPSATKFNVYSVDTHQNQTDTLTLLVCWKADIKTFALQFDDAVNIVGHSGLSGSRLQTCAITNDTIQYERKRPKVNDYKLLLTIRASAHKHYTFRAYFDRKKHHHRNPPVLYYKYSPRILSTDITRRRKRSNVDIKPMTALSDCGVTRSCFRYGANDCEHFDCKYFLSYTVSSSIADIELSAKTPGWVAVGFSSDSVMGGDEVIACSVDRPMSNTIIAATYENPYSHDQTQKKEDSSIITLKKSELRDGYLYCRLTRPVSAEDHLDLTSEWFQLYAYGPVSQGGELEKHSITPTVSSKMRSLLQKVNIHTNGSPGTSAVTSLYISIGVVILSVT